MTHKVLIDYNARGWADEKSTKIQNNYEIILRVGEPPNPPMGSNDEVIATFCEENNCDLLSNDKKAYIEMLKNKRVKAVQISKYEWDETGKQQVYLIKIL